MSEVLLIIQARNGSTRLPGKVCRDLFAGKTLLGCLLGRLDRCTTVSEIVVATTALALDDSIAQFAAQEGVKVFRGSEDDVLGRFVGAAVANPSDYIVRICADSPIHDAEVVDAVVREALKRPHLDYVSNMHPESYPYGLAVEVLPRDVLMRLNRLAEKPIHREHVTNYIADHKTLFGTHNVVYERDLSHFRLVVDYPEDFELAKQLYSLLADNGIGFSWRSAIDALESDPRLLAINALRNDRVTKQSSHHQ